MHRQRAAAGAVAPIAIALPFALVLVAAAALAAALSSPPGPRRPKYAPHGVPLHGTSRVGARVYNGVKADDADDGVHRYYHDYAGFLGVVSQLKTNRRYVRLELLQGHSRSARGEPLFVLRLSDFSESRYRNGNKRNHTSSWKLHHRKSTTSPVRDGRCRMLLSFGEHPRELISVELMIFLARKLLRDAERPCSTNEGLLARFLLQNCEVHMVMINPDGKLAMEKQQKQNVSDPMCLRHNGRGVDLNRNFPWGFGGPGSSNVLGEEEYRGEDAFSELESQFLRELTNKYEYMMFASVHSGERQVFVPFADSQSRKMRLRRPTTRLELAAMRRAISESSYFSQFRSGITYEKNTYSADGTIIDYMAGVRNITMVFCAEIFGGPEMEDCFEQFNPRTQDLSEILHEVGSFFMSLMRLAVEAHTGELFKDASGRAVSSMSPYAIHKEQNIKSLGLGGIFDVVDLLDETCEVEDALRMVFDDADLMLHDRRYS